MLEREIGSQPRRILKIIQPSHILHEIGRQKRGGREDHELSPVFRLPGKDPDISFRG